MHHLIDISNQFNISSPIVKVKPLGEGNINKTFIAYTKDQNSYILQRKNKNVFVNIPAMMDNIMKITHHIKEKARKQGKDELLATITHIGDKKGNYYVIDPENEYWTLSWRIPHSYCHAILSDPKMIYSSANALAFFQNYLSDFNLDLYETLPNFHDIRHRINQWDRALLNDAANRIKYLTREIEWIESRRDEMIGFAEEINQTSIPKRVSHNDTKPSNILFNDKNEVICIIDLDTVMNDTILYDFGDAIRTHTNTGKEDESNLNRVNFNFEFYKIYSKGYLDTALNFLHQNEIECLAMSAKYICYEQILRFLMDYINGDIYYKIDYPDHNLIRTRAQYKLLQDMENQFDDMQVYINDLMRNKK